MEFTKTASGEGVAVHEATETVAASGKAVDDALKAFGKTKVVGFGWDQGRLSVRVKEEK